MAVALALLIAAAPAEVGPSDQHRVYANARLALRDGDPAGAVRLWLLRNALEDQTGRVSAGDADFGSVTWAALGQLGLCPDGLPRDDDAAGLWPLALHNWTLRHRSGRRPPARTATFPALTVDRQQRHVSVLDVLDAGELAALELRPGRCLGPRVEMVRAGELPWARWSDRQVTARFLQHLIEAAQHTLDPALTRGQAVLSARLFELDLLLAGLAEQEARREARSRSWTARRLGLGKGSMEALEASAAPSTLADDSRAAGVLRAAADWPASEWMALAPDRRRYLFDQARSFGVDPQALDAVALALVDAHLASGDGAEVEAWIARFGRRGDTPTPAAQRRALWDGPRGASLLALGPDSGFGEASVIALHRGIDALETGRVDDALRALAAARATAPESREAAQVAALSRRWLAHVAGQFEITDELVTTLRALLPRTELAPLLEDLLWRAAWRADAASFARGLAAAPDRTASSRRLTLLAPLAQGDVAGLAAGVAAGLRTDPGETLRFVEELLARLEREDAATRSRHRSTLAAVARALAGARAGQGWPARFDRRADAAVARGQSIVEGTGGLLDGPQASGRALAPDHAVHAGVVRLAPSDPVPWPFSPAPAPPPSALAPIALTPVEWRGEDGAWVLGWAIGR